MLADVRLNRQIDDPWLNPIAEARGLGQSIVVASRVPFLLASRSTSSKLVDQPHNRSGWLPRFAEQIVDDIPIGRVPSGWAGSPRGGQGPHGMGRIPSGWVGSNY